VAGCYECGNEPSGSIQRAEFLLVSQGLCSVVLESCKLCQRREQRVLGIKHRAYREMRELI
jgi:hypothetical protein